MKNVLKDKTYAFALRIVKLDKYLMSNNEYVISKQILKSGTSIGAQVAEAEFAQSKADFISKLHIGLKEASETRYWIDLLNDGEYIDNKMYKSLYLDVEEIINILVKSIKTSKDSIKAK